MMKIVVVILAVVASLASAQTCKGGPAKQYSGLVGATLGLVRNGVVTTYQVTGRMVTDEEKRLQGGAQQIHFPGGSIDQRYLINYDEQMVYSAQQGKCYTKAVPPYFASGEMQYLGTFEYGVKEPLLAEAYMVTVPPSAKYNGTSTVTMTLQRDTCVPLQYSTTTFVTSAGVTEYEMTAGSMVNMTLGISDPTLLNMPPECKHFL